MVLLLTPGSVVSPIVTWEREAALALNKRVIALMIQSCQVPSELATPHYHSMDTSESYRLGFAALVRDLNELMTTQPASGVVFQIQNASHSAIGPGATVINSSPKNVDESK